MVSIWHARATERGPEGLKWDWHVRREKGRVRVNMKEVWTGGHWLDYIGLCGPVKDFGFEPEYSGEPLKTLEEKSR